MAQFTDTRGLAWTINITIADAMRLKADLDVDLLNLEQGDPPLLTRLGTDDTLLAQVIAALLMEQMEQHDLSHTDIFERFDGATLLASSEAFWASLSDFFLSRGQTAKAKMIAKQLQTIQTATTIATERLDKIDVPNAVGNAFSRELERLEE